MISKEKKQAIIAEYGRCEGDTGSPEVQVAILTARIQKRSAENGWTETWNACIPERKRYREISCSDRKIRSEKIINHHRAEISPPCF